jgi:hypothetical protein
LLYATKEENSSIKVIDFGTSRKIIANEFLTNRLGTVNYLLIYIKPFYTAPEVLK